MPATASWFAPLVLLSFADLLAAAPALEGIAVWEAHPGDDLPKEAIVLLNADGDQEWAALGRHSREETFVIRGSVFVVQDGATHEAIRTAITRAHTIAKNVADVVIADPTLGGAVRVAEFKAQRIDGGANVKSRWSEATFEVACGVRIQSS
jgi:hypothetical protein